jgi:hypothetical protein
MAGTIPNDRSDFERALGFEVPARQHALRVSRPPQPPGRRRIDPLREREHLPDHAGHVLVEQAVVMRDPIAQLVDAAHAGRDLLTGGRTMGKRAMQSRAPEAVIATTEECGPESERQARNRARPDDLLVLANPLDSADDLLDRPWSQHLEVQQPGPAERRLRLPSTETAVDSVAHDHLDPMNHRERCSAQFQMPLVEHHSPIVVMRGSG